MTLAEIAAALWAGNIGLRMPPDAIGLDIDAYKGGLATLQELVGRLGKLPPTWISHSGRNDGSGIRFFRVPPGMGWVAGLPGIEIIQRGHRYACAWPSIHPDGRSYGIWDMAEGGPVEALPAVEDLPDLPWAWIAYLSRASSDDATSATTAATFEEAQEFIAACTEARRPGYLGVITDHFRAAVAEGKSRHDTAQHCLIWAFECCRAGLIDADLAITVLGDLWRDVLRPEEERRAELHSAQRVTEFDAMLRHAVGKANAKSADEMAELADEVAGPRLLTTTPAPTSASSASSSDPPADEEAEPFWLDWATFGKGLDDRRWLVERFWPWGRALAVWAPGKEGKSELALWIAVNLALGRDPWTLEAVEPISVAYFDWENTEEDLVERLLAFDVDWSHGLERLHYAQFPRMHPLDTEAGGNEAIARILEVGAQAVVFDAFGRAITGEENEADTLREFYRYTGQKIKRLGIGYLRTDQAGKNIERGPRGTSAKRDDVDIIWLQRRVKGSNGVTLDCTGSSRVSGFETVLKLERIEVDGAIRYTTPIRIGWPAGTAEKAAELDALELELDIGRPAAITALRAAGLTPGNSTVLAAALKYRRERAK